MASTNRNPDAGGIGASGKNVPGKNSPDHSQTSGSAQPILIGMWGWVS